jgi:hypothetical protein
MFDFFANSFMIECSQNEINTKVELEKIDMIKITEIEQKFYNKDYSKKENKELEELRAENKNLRTELEGIKDSRSWKIINKFRK